MRVGILRRRGYGRGRCRRRVRKTGRPERERSHRVRVLAHFFILLLLRQPDDERALDEIDPGQHDDRQCDYGNRGQVVAVDCKCDQFFRHVNWVTCPPGALMTRIPCENPAGQLACPGAPCGPGGPTGPTGPAGPASPFSPFGPVSPIGPTGPGGPCSPFSPCGPTGPAGPCGPVVPPSGIFTV